MYYADLIIAIVLLLATFCTQHDNTIVNVIDLVHLVMELKGKHCGILS